MRVLIGCESSGVMREAFRRRGCEAWSCDLLPADDGSPWHFQCDIRHVLNAMRGYFDLFIVHPECTYLCVSGLHWNTRGAMVDGVPRAQKTEESLVFVQEMLDADIPHIALENPRGCISTRIRKPDDEIQPYMFGDDASKLTCLWLKNLPKLVRDPAKYVEPRMVLQPNGKFLPRWANQTDSGQNKLPPSEDRWKERSKTYEGIAEACAEQYIRHILATRGVLSGLRRERELSEVCD